MRPLERILIANRGEIALRIARTCHRMGLSPRMVCSEADRAMPHVDAGDAAVCLGGAAPADSYLHIERLLDAARRMDCQAIHPGYGFLSEQAAFARAVTDAGLVFIGPAADTIARLGSKKAARALADAAGVPTVPAWKGALDTPEAVAEAVAQVGLPALVKASAGGGGKGMQIIRRPDEAWDLVESARRLARSAFGDDTLILERYVEQPRHIEVQILGDHHGQLVSLFERECSLQRRYQKIIEESPSTALDPALRTRICEAAVAVGRQVGYHNAGTVEFILAPDGAFYFLEVNTRLQVEHPVTEGVTGLDLVEWQIRVARGEPLGSSVLQARQTGAALECRIYAEDPAQGYLPSTGRLLRWVLPQGDGVRVDAGVREGDEVSAHYDPMLAKLITTGSDRAEATLRMQRALRCLQVAGVRTNRGLLLDILADDAWQQGALHTHLLADRFDHRPAPALPTRTLAVAAAWWVHSEASAADDAHLLPRGWRLWGHETRWLRFDASDGADHEVEVRRLGRQGETAFEAMVGDARHTLHVDASGALWVDGVRESWWFTLDGAALWLGAPDGGAWCLYRRGDAATERAPAADGEALAPIAGRVVAVKVQPGQDVQVGDTLVVIEAMKMEHSVLALRQGTIKEVFVAEGDQVTQGTLLVR
jgi:3-methylcrotonyl-CoA carboxylase alpha subunit